MAKYSSKKKICTDLVQITIFITYGKEKKRKKLRISVKYEAFISGSCLQMYKKMSVHVTSVGRSFVQCTHLSPIGHTKKTGMNGHEIKLVHRTSLARPVHKHRRKL